MNLMMKGKSIDVDSIRLDLRLESKTVVVYRHRQWAVNGGFRYISSISTRIQNGKRKEQ